MKDRDLINVVKERAQLKIPGGVSGLLWVLVIVGLATFLVSLATKSSDRAWQSFLVNFLFWSGLGQSGIIFSATLQITNAKWGRSLKRIAEATAVFLPFSFLLFIVIFWGRQTIFPWISQPIPAKQVWLNVPFLFTRNLVGLLFLYGLSLLFVYYSLRPDLGMITEKTGRGATGLIKVLIRHWRGLAIEQNRCQRVLSILSPIILILYSFVFTLLSFDLVMSLDPQWFSTLFGAYFFVGNFYLGLAVLAVLTVVMRWQFKLEAFIDSSHFHDLGKLMFAFCMLTGDFFWSQYLTIWYGDLPHEIDYVILRVFHLPWAHLSWSVLLAAYIIPFIILLSRGIKKNPITLVIISLVIVIGMWFERYLLIVPSIWHESYIPFGIMEIMVTLGYGAGFILAFLAFIKVFPVLPISDPLFREKIKEDSRH
ncbi:MAG: hypothetical protein HY730_07645 [Candidatus Tectomicrobia bacterium]|uniref:Polysulfide reductase n=1 Tax=Tectimicrobiota bacterium TaxID=2528274 RepID=A0A933GN90_UNCTE|nr:hypothetical protein [Candidatus Tectomicrobia bacterium]